MKAKVWTACFAVVLMCVGVAGAAEAGELGHYLPGAASIRDFVVPPEPGFYYSQYNIFYTTDTYKDRNGNSVDSLTIGPLTLDVDADVDAFALVPTFIWVSPWEVLGASYAAFIAPSAVNTSVQVGLRTETRFGRSVDESNFAFGDLYVRPIWLGWNSEHFAVSAAYGFYAPSGKYDDGAVDNTGLGFFTHELQAGLTWYPWEHQGTAAMVAGTYEIHHGKDDVDITPGVRFSLDWGLSQFVPINEDQSLLVELGLAGYSQWQVERDSGDDVMSLINTKDEIHAAGLQVGLASVPWNASLTFRYLHEFEAEARFEGELFTLTLAKGF